MLFSNTTFKQKGNCIGTARPSRHLHAGFILGVLATTCSMTSAQPAYVAGVSDWLQPFYSGAPGGMFGQWSAWCVPSSAANIAGYYHEIHSVQAIGDNLVFPATNPWGNPRFKDDLADGSGGPRADFGWFFDTNGLGVGGAGAHRGTKLADVESGLQGYFDYHNLSCVQIINYGAPQPNLDPNVYVDFDNTGDPQNIHNDADAFALITQEIDAGRPMLGHFRHGNIITINYVYDPANGLLPDAWHYSINDWGFDPTFECKESYVDQQTGETWDCEEGLGHTVTIVGYWLGSDPTNPLSGSVDAVLVLDNNDFSQPSPRVPRVLPWTNSPWTGITMLQGVDAFERQANFDQYNDGDQLHGVNGWKGWDNDPAFSAPVTSAQSYSPSLSVDISGDADLVHEYCLVDETGILEYGDFQYIPSSFQSGGSGQFAGSYFMLLNTYNDGGPYNWSVQMQFDSNDGMLKVFHGDGTNTIDVPYITDRWVKIGILVDLDNDWTQVYYDDNLIAEYTWTGGVLGDGGGALDIAAVDLYANGSSSIFYDDILLEPYQAPCPADLDGNGSVGTSDLLALFAAWGTNPGGPPDFDGDGTVGTSDLLILFSQWGPC